MKVIHQSWALVGQILVVDDDGNAIELGKDAQGNPAKVGTIQIPVSKFRGNAFQDAYADARKAVDETLAKYQSKPTGEDATLAQTEDQRLHLIEGSSDRSNRGSESSKAAG